MTASENDADNEYTRTSTLPFLWLPLHELLFVNLLLMHSLHMPRDVHLLLRSVDTMGTLELGLLATFPLLMIPQAALQLVNPAAGRTIEALWIWRTGAETFAEARAGSPHDRRHAPSLPGRRPLKTSDAEVLGWNTRSPALLVCVPRERTIDCEAESLYCIFKHSSRKRGRQCPTVIPRFRLKN